MRFTKSDLIPYEGFASLDDANRAVLSGVRRSTGEIHYETRARPVERLEIERPLFRALPALRPAVACGEDRQVDRLATARFCSARYSVPHRLVGQLVQVAATDRDVVIMHGGIAVAQHALLAPGEASIVDAHYPTPAPTGVRALRPRTPSEHAFLALGAEAEDYLRAASAAGTARLHERLEEALSLARTRGENQARQALGRATTFSRFAHGGLASIPAISHEAGVTVHETSATSYGLGAWPPDFCSTPAAQRSGSTGLVAGSATLRKSEIAHAHAPVEQVRAAGLVLPGACPLIHSSGSSGVLRRSDGLLRLPVSAGEDEFATREMMRAVEERPNLYTRELQRDDDDPPGYRGAYLRISQALGATETSLRLFELPPGESLCPYHYEYVEEWLLLLSGELDLRTPSGTERLMAGAVACFPSGPDGAHKTTCPTGTAKPARFVIFSSAREPSVAVYPDSDKIGVWVPGGADNVMLHRADGRVPYYDEEA